jgi:dTDP-4-dehydrorhamnose 3,5-epimerase
VKFTPTPIPGAFLVEIEPIEDERGFFARTWCAREFEAAGLSSVCVQRSVSYNRKRGTLRGLHYQSAPHQEDKLVQVTRGSVFDVVVDLRPESSAFGRWEAFELSAANRLSLYIPGRVGHGFQTLEDDSEVVYQMSEYYYPDLARGVRWNDPVLAISWPVARPIVSERDQALPLLHVLRYPNA